MRHFLALLFLLALAACKLPETERGGDKADTEELPNQTADTIEVVYSEKGILKLKLKSSKLVMSEKAGQQFNEFPEGLYMDFFDKEGKKNADLVGDYGFDDQQKRERYVKGNVIIKSSKDGWVYTTDELYINENKDSIHNNGKPVKITKPDGTLIQGDTFYSNSRMDFISIKNVFDSQLPVEDSQLNSVANPKGEPKQAEPIKARER